MTHPVTPGLWAPCGVFTRPAEDQGNASLGFLSAAPQGAAEEGA